MWIRIIIIFAMVLSFSQSALATGDCDDDKTVSIAEVQSAINMFLGLKPSEFCVDEEKNGSVSIAEVQRTINTFLGLIDISPPTLITFTLPTTAAAQTVSVTGLSASDAVGVTGYLITESSTAPAATATGWSATAPATFTFISAGSKTAYAWAKDAAGNVSDSRAATVVIDTTAPTVSTFSLPATATSLTISVSLLASDNIGVTGYLITESSTSPAATATDWSATAPTTFTFSSAGIKTAYAWAKDAAGNVSGSRASITDIPTTKTVTLIFSSQGTNPSDIISGFDLKVTLPPGSSLPTTTNGGPLPGVVVFAGTSSLADNFYDSSLLRLSSLYIFEDIPVGNFIALEEFITILFTVPIGYAPNAGDITYSFVAKNPSGDDMKNVTATFKFN